MQMPHQDASAQRAAYEQLQSSAMMLTANFLHESVITPTDCELTFPSLLRRQFDHCDMAVCCFVTNTSSYYHRYWLTVWTRVCAPAAGVPATCK